MKVFGLIVVGCFSILNIAVADLIAMWDFGLTSTYTESVTVDNAVGIPTLTGMSAGSGYDSDGQGGTDFTDAEGLLHPAGQALAWASGVNDGNQEWVLSIDLTGYQDLSIRWDYRSTSSGPNSAVLDYKVGSGNWTTLENLSITQGTAYHSYSKNLSSISAIENQSSVQFRLSGFSGGSGSGTYRVDNLEVTGIPEPAAIGLIGMVGVGLLFVRRIFRI